MPELKVEDAKKELQGLVKEAEKKQETLLSEPERKALEETHKKEQEAEALRQEQIKKDTELLAKKPEELSVEEKKRRETLDEEKRKEEEAKLSAEEKDKRTQATVQKRIDEVVNDLKQVKDKSAKEIELLQKEAQLLRQENENLNKRISQPETDPTVALRQKEQERLTKYLEEDVGLPKERRREMSRDELTEWREEDPIAYDEWISERTIRRARERSADQKAITEKQFAEHLGQRWVESHSRVLIRHPELNTDKREAELEAQGKTDKEVYDILCQENEKYRITQEIIQANKSYLKTKENAPELVMAEMERRLVVKTSQPTQTEEQKQIAELAKKVEELEAQLQEAQMTDIGANSTVTRIKQTAEKLTEQENLLIDTMKSAGATQEGIDNALKNFRAKKGKE